MIRHNFFDQFCKLLCNDFRLGFEVAALQIVADFEKSVLVRSGTYQDFGVKSVFATVQVFALDGLRGVFLFSFGQRIDIKSLNCPKRELQQRVSRDVVPASEVRLDTGAVDVIRTDFGEAANVLCGKVIPAVAVIPVSRNTSVINFVASSRAVIL